MEVTLFKKGGESEDRTGYYGSGLFKYCSTQPFHSVFLVIISVRVRALVSLLFSTVMSGRTPCSSKVQLSLELGSRASSSHRNSGTKTKKDELRNTTNSYN